MAHSIETRSPFLDYRVVEWAARQPRQNLINGQQGKLPLRRLARRFLPVEVQKAHKRGFSIPLDAWFREPVNLAFYVNGYYLQKPDTVTGGMGRKLKT